MDAAGRKDYQELDRLNASCPRRQYLMDDYEYTRRKTCFLGMALYEAYEVARLEAMACFGLVLILGLDDDENLAAGEPILHAALGQRAARIEAWELFCREIGVNADALRATLGRGKDDYWMLIEDCARQMRVVVEPDAQRVQTLVTALVDFWVEHVGTLP